ncbi:MFS transporter [Sinirhodobacter populi]|uniref:MFS transporter n=1 Tax=Paenirhodobacter populi TaxID=2306993 RepID=A0A443K8H3_9RHOB|nr:MFS transporter [Sinirhodobacter populi]RWR29058.1 MFS transporter [Sinirhodobacter populi]
MPDHRPRPAILRVLIGTQFGLFYAGNGLSSIGTWMQRVACGWLIWDWTHSVFWLGILSAGDLLPVILIGPIAGVAADRWDRVRQNMLAQIVSVVLAVLMAALLAVGWLGLIGTLALITVQGTLTAVIQPARLAMVQQMVPRADMGIAVALNSVNVNLARMLGPAAAGVMILHMDILWIFVVNAAVTLLFVLVLMRLRLAPQEKRPHRRSFLGELTEGFAHILRAPALRLILLVMLCGGSLVRAMIELAPAIAARSFPDNATGLAVVTGAAAFGAVCAGLTMGPVSSRRLLYSVLLWWGLGAAASVALTHTDYRIVATISAMIVGACIARGLISTQTFVQLTTPDVLRGRVLSVHGLIARGSPALGALVIGFAADRVGLALSVEVTSITLILLLLFLFPFVRNAAHWVEDAA